MRHPRQKSKLCVTSLKTKKNTKQLSRFQKDNRSHMLPIFYLPDEGITLRDSNKLLVPPIIGDKAGTRTQDSGLDPSPWGVSTTAPPLHLKKSTAPLATNSAVGLP